MRFILIFLLLVCIILWLERVYWRRTAELMEKRLLGRNPTDSVQTFWDAWIDSRIERRLRRRNHS
ncbi:MAG TPA: hypothetical protein PLM33_14465 [Acidobacteriota bacterium]|nr:hypothetical protein [Acidobacteriota bacterium]HRR26547.1 hypothetical protein [Acidobacteriota bacterium]HRV08394.1 hypothetical protein [Acidobacteriota bacterium]